MTMLRLNSILSIFCAIFVMTPAVLAKGIVTVEQINGETDTHIDVEINSTEDVLYLKPSEGVDLVIITKEACKMENQIQACNAGELKLDTYGVYEEIPIDKIVVFTNNTSKRQPIQNSDITLSPKTVLLEILTTKGTYITGMGRIDNNDIPE